MCVADRSLVTGMPDDTRLVTGMPDDTPSCEVFFCAPAIPDAPTSALLTRNGQQVGIRTDASDPAGQSAAMAAVGSTNWIHLDASSESSWTMIPAENVISVCDGTPTQVAVTSFTAQQVPGLAYALQLGVDALVLAPPDDDDKVQLWEAAAIARAQRAEDEEDTASPPLPQMDERGGTTAPPAEAALPGAMGPPGRGQGYMPAAARAGPLLVQPIDPAFAAEVVARMPKMMVRSLNATAEAYEADPAALERVRAAGGYDSQLWRMRYRMEAGLAAPQPVSAASRT